MTSTRENVRRELRELSKLADEMRKTRSPDVRSSGEWSALGAAIAADGTAGSASAAAVATDPSEPSPIPPPRPSDVTVPPAVASYAPAFESPLGTAANDTSKPQRRMVMIGGVIGVAAVIALVATFSRSHGAAPRAANDGNETVAAATPAPQAPADPPAAQAPAPPAATPPAARAQDQATNQVAAAAESPSSSTTSTKHHGHAGPAARPATKAASPAVAAKAAPKKTAAPAAPAGNDSLDDLMRKAVNSPSK